MSAIYLINTTSNTLVGRFESVTDAEIAGELLLGTDGYYVGDAQDLGKSWKVAELFKLAQSVGETAPNWNFKAKTWCVERLVELVDAFDFAPSAPAPEVKPEPKAPGKRAKSPKLALRAALEAGELVCVDAWIAMGYTEKQIRDELSYLKNPKYCGKGLSPLNIVKEGRGAEVCYRLA